jgi:hypothetical protein
MAITHENWALLGELATEPESRHRGIEAAVAGAFGASLLWAACVSAAPWDTNWRVAGFLVIAAVAGYRTAPAGALVAGLVVGLFLQGFGYASGGVLDGSALLFAHLGLACAVALIASLLGRERRSPFGAGTGR